MLYVREMMCFNLNLALKMYPKMYIFLVFRVPHPYVIK